MTNRVAADMDKLDKDAALLEDVELSCQQDNHHSNSPRESVPYWLEIDYVRHQNRDENGNKAARLLGVRIVAG